MSGAFRYGDPSASTKTLGPKPNCWGTQKYDNEDRECRACGFQNTCKDQILKTTPVQPQIAGPTPSTYYNQFLPHQTYATPQTIVPQAPTKITTPSIPNQRILQIKPEIPQPVAARPATVIRDRYGQFQDPMFLSVKGTPSIMRPQLEGESFSKRVMKNMLLASAESALGEVLLGVRQLIWAPIDEDKEK